MNISTDDNGYLRVTSSDKEFRAMLKADTLKKINRHDCKIMDVINEGRTVIVEVDDSEIDEDGDGRI